jgi:mono/diheme cytochrome c family protein
MDYIGHLRVYSLALVCAFSCDQNPPSTRVPAADAKETAADQNSKTESQKSESSKRRPLGDSNDTLDEKYTAEKENNSNENTAKPTPSITSTLKTGEAQNRALCARAGNDRVRRTFCSTNGTKVTSLKSLQQALGLSATAGSFALAAQSNGIAMRHVSAINPRLIQFTKEATQDYAVLGFVRGESTVEIAAHDKDANALRFYLVKYALPCDPQCTSVDLQSPASETNWRNVTVYEDKDLENTVSDCHVCHQPNGSGTQKLLRMPSLQLPWPHWLLDVSKVAVRPPSAPGLRVPNNGRIPGLSGINFDANRNLIKDFMAAHKNDGDFAGLPVGSIELSAPNELANFLVARGFSSQPNEAAETASTPIGPLPVTYPGRSVGWKRAYAASLTGDELSPPYPGDSVPSATELASLTQSDLHDLGLAVAPGASPKEILDQACKLCHNDKLNQNVSRAKFSVDLQKLDRRIANVAIERLLLPKNDEKRMPPAFFKQLTTAEISALKTYLEQNAP